MGIPFRELQQRIDSEDFAYYLAYERIEPDGEERADLRAGIISSTVANAAGADTSPIDFMPDFEAKKAENDKHKAAETGLDFLMARQNAVIESGK